MKEHQPLAPTPQKPNWRQLSKDWEKSGVSQNWTLDKSPL